MNIKKTVFILIILGVAIVSSAATIGGIKLFKMIGSGGPIIVLSDKRCAECDAEKLVGMLKPTFPGVETKIIDYSDGKGRKLYDQEGVEGLPAVLLPLGIKDSDGYKKVERFAATGKKHILLRTGGSFDPKAEICDNTIDDNGDSAVDCLDATCKSNWKCMEKKDKPDVDVFVMSHCPYGTQIEKGLLPVWDLLGGKINLNIRFCDYAMHGKKEIDEQTRQYCMQNMDAKKYRKYLGCFLKDGEVGNKCVKDAGVDEASLASCIKETDGKFSITKGFENKEKWKGNFPPFPIYADMTAKFGVQGSPTLVVNGVVAEAARTPKALLDAICTAFKEKPAECSKALSTDNPTPGFGFKKGESGAPSASCGS